MVISKELIKNVLAKETEYLSDDFTFNIEDNYILFVDDGESQFEVNVYEFAFKCKEWAFKNGHIIYCCARECFIYFSKTNKEMFFKKNNNELESIIEACNWILEQQK